jgi:hypothetical protein
MKACPFCAEQIQDAAVVCKHCNRTIAPPTTPPAGGSPRSGAVVGGLILVVAVMFGVVHVRQADQEAMEARQRADALVAAQRARDSVAAVTPTYLTLLDKQNYGIRAHSYLLDEVTVVPHTHCAVVGTVTGGGDGVETMVLPYDQMVAWQANPQSGTPVWRSGLTTRAVVDAALPPGAGHYVVVISNRQAWLLVHQVDASVQLKCTRSWPAGTE